MEINYAKLSEQELIEYANAVLVSDEVIGGSLLPRCAVTNACSIEKGKLNPNENWNCSSC